MELHASVGLRAGVIALRLVLSHVPGASVTHAAWPTNAIPVASRERP